MANQRRPSGGEQESTPAPDQEVVRLPGPESGPGQQLDTPLSLMGEEKDRMQVDRELNPMEEREVDLEAAAEELGVAWDLDEREPEKTTPMGWLVLIGVLLLVMGLGGLFMLVRGEREETRKNQTEQKERRKQTGEAQELLERVEQVVRRYLATTSVEEKSRYVRHRARVLPLMREYYRRRELTSARFQSIGDIKPAEVENYPFFGIDVMVEGKSDARLLLVEDCADGELRFDWESEVNYQPMEISDYLEKKPTEAMEFRVYVGLDTFYGYEFSDQERYQSLKLTFRDEDEFLFGYIEKGSADGRGLAALLGARGVSLPLRLRMRFLPDTKSRRSVLVEKVLATSWVQIEETESAVQP